EAPDQMKKHVCSTKRSILEFVLALILTGSAVLGAAAPGETEEKAPPGSTSTAAPPSAPGETEQKAPPDRMSTAATPQTVLAPLQRTLAWYQGARLAMQSIGGVLDADFIRGDQQTAQRVLQRAFETARARAVLVGRPGPAESADASSRQSRVARTAQ